MSDDTLSYNELRERLAKAEASLESLRRGEVDLVIGTDEPLVVRFKSLAEEVERLGREWQTTFDSIKDAVWVLDAGQRVLRSNRAAERIFQRPLAEMTGKHCWEIVHGTQEPIPECPILRMRKSLKRERMELQVGERWFEVTVDPILNENNGLSGAVHAVSDITERKQAEESLKESETRNRIIAGLISDYAYIFRVTEDGELKGEWVTESFTKVFGLTREEIDARGGWRSLVYPEDADLALQHARKVAGGQADICEMRWVTSGGEVRWLRDYAQPVFDAAGKRVVRIYGASQAITARKQAEDALHRSENLFKNLFQHHAAVKLLIDPDTGRLLAATHAAVDFYGWPREQLLQMRIQEINTAQPEEVAEAMEQVKDRKKAFFEFRHRRADGSIRDVAVFSSRIESDGKTLLHAIVHDITERKRSEAEVRRLTMAIEQTGEVILVTDPEGNIQYVNPAFEAVSGYTRREAIGQTPRLLKSGRQDEAFYRDLWETITSGRIWQGRMVNKRKDGTLYTEETTISPVKDDSGRIVSFVAVKRDITEHLRISLEQARLQEQLQQAQKMESIGRLAGGVAHDFNNMLSIILGYADIVHQKLHPGDPLREDVEEILKAGRRSADLTRQLLAFSRKQTLQPEVLDLNEVIRNIEKMLHRLIGEDIGLDLSLSMELPRVKADPGQIEQVIMNLAVNARDAMPMGGKLLIETSEVELDDAYAQNHPSVAPGKYVMLAISDTGCGMEKKFSLKFSNPSSPPRKKGKARAWGLPQCTASSSSPAGTSGPIPNRDKARHLRSTCRSSAIRPRRSREKPHKKNLPAAASTSWWLRTRRRCEGFWKRFFSNLAIR
jgi:PAS domain S-box-containing protein